MTDNQCNSLCSKEAKISIVTSVYVSYFIATCFAFVWISDLKHQLWTLVIAATTSSLHLLFLGVSAVFVACGLPPYEGYETYPSVLGEKGTYLYKTIDVLLFISAIACAVGCLYTLEGDCNEAGSIAYYIVAMYGNSMTIVSVLLCIFKTCLQCGNNTNSHKFTRVQSNHCTTTF